MCGATQGGLSVAGIDVTKEAVIQGRVLRGGDPVAGAYVRLLDSGGEFTAEVPTSATGQFRFFAAPGTWTLRALVPGGSVDREVVAQRGVPSDVAITVIGRFGIALTPPDTRDVSPVKIHRPVSWLGASL